MEIRFLDGHGADRTSISAPAWLTEVREMRARVLYDQGRRPFFRLADGSFDDSDSADLHAYHVIARSQGRAVDVRASCRWLSSRASSRSPSHRAV